MNTCGRNVSRGDNIPWRPRSGVLGGLQQVAATLRHAFLRNSGQSRAYVEIGHSHGVTDLNILGACEEAEEWLEKVEHVFQVMHCPEDERAKTAGYFLRGGTKT